MRLSVIIPTFNRSDSLRKTLASIKSMERSPDLEVIVVDNGSIDSTKKICVEFAESFLNFRYIYDNEPGLLTGRHRGALDARGEILCFLDDDVILSAGWSNAVIKACDEHPDIDLFTGPCLPHFELTPPKWLEDFWYVDEGIGRFCSWLSLLDLGKEKKVINANLVWGLNFIIRRVAFYELKGFHPDTVPINFQMFQGDGETGLTMKAEKSGKKAMYHAGILLHHEVPKTRLTKEYFGKRAFFQGVCDSYSDLRKGKPSLSSTAMFIESSKAVLRKFIKREVLNDKPDDVKEIRDFTKEKYAKGYQFHQQWFKKSPVVREWVLRDNYLDYKLPII